MLRVLTTKHGQLIAKVEATMITIYDSADMKPLASADYNAKKDKDLKIIRQLASALSLRKKLQAKNITLIA